LGTQFGSIGDDLVGEFRRFGGRGLFACALALGVTAPSAPATAQSSAYMAADAAVVGNAIRAINAGNPAAALALRAQAQDPAAKKLIAWYVFSRRDARGDFAEITTFLRENPRWPALDYVARAADRSITAKTPAAQILAWFAHRLPETGDGLMDAVAALKAQGKAEEAQSLLRRAWARLRLTDAEEAELLKRHGADLRPEDHLDRISHLAGLGQKRLANGFLARVALDKAHREAAEARLKLRDESLRRKPAVVEAALKDVPAVEQKKEGFLYDLMRWHRRGNRHGEAWAIAASLPANLAEPEHWWKEFEILIRGAIGARQHESAYQLARNHRLSEGDDFAEAEFLAGFIAFRLLGKPDLGAKHFAALAKESLGGWDAARLAYWHGRALEAKGDKAGAQELLARAAAHAATFYGQLAAARLGHKELRLDAAVGATPQDRFWSDELVRAAHLLRAAGDPRGARAFAIRAAWTLPGWTVAQHGYVSKFVMELTAADYRGQTSVRMAKLAIRDGAAVTAYGFPTLDLPQANSVEPALVYAVIRQESEFVATAKSHAGARGLMQLMPFTAKYEAKDARLPYALARLTADPAYNLRLGTQHLQRLREYYQGSYPLMIAAYNAGAGRVDRWLAQHGDPRKGKLEWADWIELIPFEETRLYTKFVLENHAIYRLRLGDPLDVAKLASHWQAPRADAEVCSAELAKELADADLPLVPLGSDAEIKVDGGPENKLLEADKKKKPHEIQMMRKEKPDNRAATPDC
jgi:soluble lytic murein transglycosylase